MAAGNMHGHRKNTRSRPVLSRSSILILSGFLIGNVWGQPLHSLRALALLAGLAGIIAHFALGEVRRRSRLRKAERATQEAKQMLAGRIHRHIPRIATARRKQLFCTPHQLPQQYLTVVRAGRMPYR